MLGESPETLDRGDDLEEVLLFLDPMTRCAAPRWSDASLARYPELTVPTFVPP